MQTHAKLSPSKRHRWGVCPASLREEAKYPEEPRDSKPAAVDGTHTHTLLDHVIKNNIADPMTLIGEKMSDHDGEFVVDAARADRVKFAMSYIDTRLEQLGGSCKIYSDVKVDLSAIFGRDDLNGTADVLLISDTELEVIDYKDGMGIVEAQDNPQMDQYAWGCIAMLGDNLTQNTIRMTIIQPKLRDKGMSGVVWSSTSIDEFMRGKDRLAQQAAATDEPNAPFNPGDEQCKYCRHKGACTALSNQAMNVIGIDLSKMDVVKEAADKDPTSMSDQQIREILEAAPLIRQMLEGVEAEALKRLETGKTIEGLKLVRGRGSRAWAYDDEAMAEKLRKMGVPKDALWKTSLVSPAQAEKLVWKKRDGTQKQLSPRQLKTIAEEYIKKSEGKLTVVSASDERTAVINDVLAMFAPVRLPDWLR